MDKECRSIKNELESLRPFVDRAVSSCYPLYSEEEIREAEKRLGIGLPAPVRDLYRQMADLLTEQLLLTPLELLHWEGDFLGFYESPDDGAALGIRRGEDPNQLYWWELSDPEEESYDYWDEFSDLCEEGDRKGRKKLAKRCRAYWKKINARYPDLPSSPVRKLEYKAQYSCTLDAYGLFLALHALYEACEDFQREHPDEPLLWSGETDFHSQAAEDNQPRRIPDECFHRLHDRITQVFSPLSPRLLALETSGLQMAYLHRDQRALLLAWDEDAFLNLLTLAPPAPGLLEEMEAATGVNFRCCKL